MSIQRFGKAWARFGFRAATQPAGPQGRESRGFQHQGQAQLQDRPQYPPNT